MSDPRLQNPRSPEAWRPEFGQKGFFETLFADSGHDNEGLSHPIHKETPGQSRPQQAQKQGGEWLRPGLGHGIHEVSNDARWDHPKNIGQKQAYQAGYPKPLLTTQGLEEGDHGFHTAK